jgi:hypothetical protein
MSVDVLSVYFDVVFAIRFRLIVEHPMDMHFVRRGLILFSVGSIIGCGADSGTQIATVKPSPVGGAMVRLPNGAGLVAIKTEAANSSRSVKTKPRTSKIVAVFFANDGSTPMTPPPTAVVFELESLRSSTADQKVVPLEADPTTPHRFVSAASSFPGGVAGKLRVKIDGQDLEESFSAR